MTYFIKSDRSTSLANIKRDKSFEEDDWEDHRHGKVPSPTEPVKHKPPDNKKPLESEKPPEKMRWQDHLTNGYYRVVRKPITMRTRCLNIILRDKILCDQIAIVAKELQTFESQLDKASDIKQQRRKRHKERRKRRTTWFRTTRFMQHSSILLFLLTILLHLLSLIASFLLPELLLDEQDALVENNTVPVYSTDNLDEEQLMAHHNNRIMKDVAKQQDHLKTMVTRSEEKVILFQSTGDVQDSPNVQDSVAKDGAIPTWRNAVLDFFSGLLWLKHSQVSVDNKHNPIASPGH